MDEDDVRRPDRPEPGGKSEQQLFDEQIARASGKIVVMFGGVGILAALVLSTVALVISASKSTRPSRSKPPPGPDSPRPPGAPPQGDALGAQLFVSGKPDVGASAAGRATR